MSRLPPHHVPRPRLTDRCASAAVVLVEAAAGYGKTVLGAELVESWGVVPVEVLLEPGELSAELLAARLRAAVTRAGFTDAREAMNAAGADPAGAVDAMLDALGDESCVIIVDDAHHATRDAGQLIERIAALVALPQRLVVLARQLPQGSERLRRAESLLLDADDLALRADETLALCRSGFGLDVSADEARLLDAATGGWTAAAVLAISRAKRTNTPLHELGAAGGGSGQPSMSVGAVLDELLVALGPDRGLVAQIAPLPMFDKDLCAAVTGQPDFFERARALGLPMTPAGNGWWELPGPVRDYLAQLGDSDPVVLGRAARYYRSRDQFVPALQLLLVAGEVEQTARLLAESEARDVERVEVLELLSVIDRLPDAVLDRFPMALLHAVRACHAANLLQRRAGLVQRLDAIVSEDDEPELRRAVDAELATDLVLDGTTPAQAEELARRILETAGDREQFTRARALSVIGKAVWWQSDRGGRRSAERMREAGVYFDRAYEILLNLGQRAAAAALIPYRAVWIEFELGRPLLGVALDA